jgi:hypothetical protein
MTQGFRSFVLNRAIKKAITFKNHRMRRDGISPPTDKQYAIPYQALDAVCTNGSLRQMLPLVRSKSDFRFTPRKQTQVGRRGMSQKCRFCCRSQLR